MVTQAGIVSTVSGSATAEQAPSLSPDVSIRIAGNNQGNIYVGNRFQTYVGAVEGDLVTLVQQGDVPLVEPKRRPVDGRDRDFPGLIGRLDEIQALQTAVASAEPVDIHAPAGQGKTSLLRYLARRTRSFTDGIVYIRASGRPLEDLQEKLFAQFFRSQFPFKQYRAQLLENLRSLNALIIVDDFEFDRDTLGEFINAMPQAVFLLASETRRLWGEGQTLALPGLSAGEGKELFTRELGRSLTAEEQGLVQQLITDLDGHPLGIIQAVALASNNEDQPLAAVLGSLPSVEPAQALANSMLETTSGGQRNTRAILAAVGGRPILAGSVTAALNPTNATITLPELEEMGLAEATGDGRYRIVGSTPIPPGEAELTTIREKLLNHYILWGEANRENPALISADSEAICFILEWAAGSGRFQEAIRLARILNAPLTLDNQWQSWNQVMDTALEASRAGNLAEDEAWILHQKGTRALTLLEKDEARLHLEGALAIREQLDEPVGSSLTQYHLDLWRYLFPGPPPPPRTEPGSGGGGLLRFLVPILLVGVLAVAGIVFGPAIIDEFLGGEPPVISEPPVDVGTEPQPPDEVEPAAPEFEVDIHIGSPSEGEEFDPGDEAWFEASARHPEAGNVVDDLVWFLDGREIGDGNEFGRRIPTQAEAGFHEVTAQYIHEDGRVSHATVAISVLLQDDAGPSEDQPPSIRIISPLNGGGYVEDTPIRFVAEAGDPEDGRLDDRIVWSLGRSGESLGEGNRLEQMLPPGNYEIIASVVDDSDQIAEDRVGVSVGSVPDIEEGPGDSAPRVNILEWEISEPTLNGATVFLFASASDVEDGDLGESINWIYSEERFSRGPGAEIQLPPGRHTIVAAVVDSQGAGAEDRVSFDIEPPVPNASPELFIEFPDVDGLVFKDDEPFPLIAFADDDEDGDISDSIGWSSNVDGPLGTGPEVIVSGISEGEHLITARLTDSSGASAEASVVIVISGGLPDLVASVSQISDVEIIDDFTIWVPVRVVVTNIGGETAAPFKIAAEYLGPGGGFIVPFVDAPGSDGFYVFTDGLAADESVTLEGLFVIESPESLSGEIISIWAKADSCAGEEFTRPFCRIEESNEDNNSALSLSVFVP